MKQPNVYISTPCHSGKVDINYHTSMLATFKFMGENRIQHMINYAVNTGIDATRSKHATEFLRTDCTHMMFIDDDMVWSADLIWRMLQEEVDIVGVPYRKKMVTPVKFTIMDPGPPIRKEGSPYLIEVDALGTGMLLIKREVFEKLQSIVPAVQYNKDGPYTYMFFRHELVDSVHMGGKVYMSEDFNFCRQAKEAGFKIWAYVGEEVAHMGTVGFRGEYSEILKEKTGEDYRDTRRKFPLRFVGDATEEVYELTLECEVEGAQKLISAQGYKVINGLVIVYESMPDKASPDTKAYIEKLKSLYNTEENDKGILVLDRKAA